jgi:hypothetical protein
MRGRARRSAGAEPTAYGSNAEPCEQSSYEQSSHERGRTSNAAGAELAACSSIAQSYV